MKAIRVQPGMMPEIIDVENTLEALQQEVGGYIQTVYPFDDAVCLICNEEGKLNHLPVNRLLYREGSMMPYDILVGTFLIVGICEDDFMDLTDELTEKYVREFTRNRPLF